MKYTKKPNDTDLFAESKRASRKVSAWSRKHPKEDFPPEMRRLLDVTFNNDRRLTWGDFAKFGQQKHDFRRQVFDLFVYSTMGGNVKGPLKVEFHSFGGKRGKGRYQLLKQPLSVAPDAPESKALPYEVIVRALGLYRALCLQHCTVADPDGASHTSVQHLVLDDTFDKPFIDHLRREIAAYANSRPDEPARWSTAKDPSAVRVHL